jgi:hypothetical protein
LNCPELMEQFWLIRRSKSKSLSSPLNAIKKKTDRPEKQHPALKLKNDISEPIAKKPRMEVTKSAERSPSIPKSSESQLSTLHKEVDRYGSPSTYKKEKELPMKILALDSWEEKVDRVITICPDSAVPNRYTVYVLWSDQTRSAHDIKVANKKFPQKVYFVNI